jgi:hypothetical protein
MHHHPHWSNLGPFQTIVFLVALFLILFIYFLPTITAIRRNSPYKMAAIIVNILFGITFLGWIFALVLASKQTQPTVVIYNTPPPPR